MFHNAHDSVGDDDNDRQYTFEIIYLFKKRRRKTNEKCPLSLSFSPYLHIESKKHFLDAKYARAK